MERFGAALLQFTPVTVLNYNGKMSVWKSQEQREEKCHLSALPLSTVLPAVLGFKRSLGKLSKASKGHYFSIGGQF